MVAQASPTPVKTSPKKEILKPHKFEVWFYRVYQWFYRHKFTWLIGILVAIGLAFGIMQWLNAQQQQRQKAYFQLTQSLQQAPSPEVALEKMQLFIADYANTKEAYLVRYQQALLLKDTNAEQAIAEFEKLYTALPNRSVLQSLAVFQLVDLYREADQGNETLELLQNLKTDWEDLRLVELARTYILLNNPALAKVQLETLIVNFPDSGLRIQAEQLLQIL